MRILQILAGIATTTISAAANSGPQLFDIGADEQAVVLLLTDLGLENGGPDDAITPSLLNLKQVSDDLRSELIKLAIAERLERTSKIRKAK